MGLCRDELAARFLASLLTKDNGAPRQLADFAVECADALIARLRPATAPVVAAPVAPTRPEWVRITGPKDAVSVTVGKAYSVLEYRPDNHTPLSIKNDEGTRWFLPEPGETVSVRYPGWEPCAAPVAPAESARQEPVKGDSPRSEWVPKVGERVEINDGLGAGTLVGTVTSLNGPLVVVDVNGVEYARANRRKADAQDGDDYVEPCAAPATAAPAVVPESAREGLAKVLYESWGDNVTGYGPFDETNPYRPEWLRAADAAIAFFKANGGAK